VREALTKKKLCTIPREKLRSVEMVGEGKDWKGRERRKRGGTEKKGGKKSRKKRTYHKGIPPQNNLGTVEGVAKAMGAQKPQQNVLGEGGGGG